MSGLKKDRDDKNGGGEPCEKDTISTLLGLTRNSRMFQRRCNNRIQVQVFRHKAN